MKKLLLPCAFLLSSFAAIGQINQALFIDPRPDDKSPAKNVDMDIPSHNERLLGTMLLAVGEKPHPTAVLLHGFPGYEQNLDLAQALRRSGWNVLAVHYRGSWGTGGDFSFTHCMEDADAMLQYVLDPANSTRLRIDTKRIAIVGHSMGGFVAVQTMARHSEIKLGVLLSEANPASDTYAFTPEDMAPLHGTSAEALRQEATSHVAAWDYKTISDKFGMRPLLIVSAEDGLQKSSEALSSAMTKAGDTRAQHLHMNTDHAFASRRVAMTSTVVDWMLRN